MNNEIMEIFKTKLYFDLDDTDYIKIQNYITNLQNENERLKDIENFKFSLRKDETKTLPTVTKNYKSEYEDYKSRCEKAIERLTLNGDIQEKDVIEVFANAIRDTRNILNGGDE